jgi:hypothetical protein
MRTLAAALVLLLCTAGWAQDKSLTLYTSLAPAEPGPLALRGSLFIRGDAKR